MKELISFLTPLAILIVLYLSLQNWRNSVKAILILVIIEGALRKWFFPGASQFIYFLKDIVLICAYLRYFLFSPSESKFSIKENPTAEIIITLILSATAWCLFQAFNLSLGSPVIGIFGLRGYLLYIPLLWMLPNLFRDEEELYKFLRSYLLWVIPVGILATLQFFAPPNSPLNVYTQDIKLGVATFNTEGSNNVRVTGTFSYIAGYAVYLLVSFGLAVPMLTVKQPQWWRWATIIELLLIVGTTFMNGSRGLLYSEILFLIGYVGGQLLTTPKKAIFLIKRFTVPVIAISSATIIWFQSAINALVGRITSNNDISGRITGIFAEPFEFINLKGLDGYGVGATHQATPVMRSILNLSPGEPIPVFYESEPGRIALEIGPLGCFLWYLLRFVLIVLLWGTFLKLKRPLLRQLALSACLIHALVFTGQLVFNHTLIVYYWFLGGFLFLLPRLEKIENWKEQNKFIELHNAQTTYFPDTSYK